MNPQLLLPYGSAPAAALPRRWGEALADLSGDLTWRLAARARRTTASNHALVTGRAASEAQVRGAFRTYARYYLGLMRLAHRDPESALGPCRWEGVEALDRSLERGCGALVLSAHLGNWDLLGIALAQRYGNICVFVEKLRPRALYEFYARVRGRHGVHVAPVGSPGRLPREVLRRNGVLGLVVDRRFGSRAEFVPCGSGLLGMPTGAIRMAIRGGAAVHVGFALREHQGFRLRVGPDVAAGLPPDPQAAIRSVAGHFAVALRDAVTRNPEQWCLLQPLDMPAPQHGARGAA